ncbi:hypothetical protein POPTR_T124804v4 [Populus trichocarpa]|uniref:Uncharacterized protein n=1 Tax=Populus trichocarpa TaxID=3694 RepID=A0ACC0RHL4_POPTR|nr:hypothetical protein BDE02_09G098200 [Populus trichocarpa]KAI9215520.1 hypothetical protein POPTR_T124804v4 [Populus trichocarpa]
MKAFLVIICILLATIVFSPSISTCTAKDPGTGFAPANSGSPCGANKANCLPKSNPGRNKPKKRCESPVEQTDCDPN